MKRRFWEFQAVVHGRIAWVPASGPATETKARTLWVSPPGSSHGWTGIPGEEAVIVVFHFRLIPETLRLRLGKSPCTAIHLSAAECVQMEELARGVDRYWRKPAPGMLLCYEHALLQISHLAYESLTIQHPEEPENRIRDQVQSALSLYNENMQTNPGLPEIARACHSSPANLRRLFHKTLQASPKEVFDQLRYQRAMQLLTETTLPLAHIAEQCGFQDQSAFSRAFKNHFQCTPRDLRAGRELPLQKE
ncbi:helix-turn-helix transcriptional regulator [Puniceicoccus vermicola]|uniref:Helix-turn-helix transcriptional regulator n=1 Tax=Puniceicoccus vermicola TaxID=388746 RepID=A0A7X1E6P3_9BACT|nr:helix-turn-helix transcriptional regulator [Puniceicoccus vermicola]MBC2604326.1 helix-turn-helix transcriptional regulator [Puniceicoccus vermicola]